MEAALVDLLKYIKAGAFGNDVNKVTLSKGECKALVEYIDHLEEYFNCFDKINEITTEFFQKQMLKNIKPEVYKKDFEGEKMKEITKEEALNIIEHREPKGRFYYLDGSTWVGIDNSTGEAWVEEFNLKSQCIKWLEG